MIINSVWCLELDHFSFVSVSNGHWSGLQFAAIMSNPLLCMVQLVPTLDGSVDVPFLNYVPITLSNMDQLAALLGRQLYTRGNLN